MYLFGEFYWTRTPSAQRMATIGISPVQSSIYMYIYIFVNAFLLAQNSGAQTFGILNGRSTQFSQFRCGPMRFGFQRLLNKNHIGIERHVQEFSWFDPCSCPCPTQKRTKTQIQGSDGEDKAADLGSSLV